MKLMLLSLLVVSCARGSIKADVSENKGLTAPDSGDPITSLSVLDAASLPPFDSKREGAKLMYPA
jgi:hypothetical protein